MKKSLYLFLWIVLSCISFNFSKHSVIGKDSRERIIEEQSKNNQILKPFKLVGLLWSCTPDDEPDRGGHQSHQSHSSHSSHYSSR
jgi:hypothetical protein